MRRAAPDSITIGSKAGPLQLVANWVPGTAQFGFLEIPDRSESDRIGADRTESDRRSMD